MHVAQEKFPIYFNFDGGEVEFRGERAIVKGSVLFDFIHKFRSPNFPAVQEIGVQVEKWLEGHFRQVPDALETCRSLLKLTMDTLAYIQPEEYTINKEDEINMRKAFWLAVFSVLEWFGDDLDDKENYRTDASFKKMNHFFFSTLYKIFNFEFSEKEELKIYIEEFRLFEKYPKFYELFYLWFYFSQDFFADPLMQTLGINQKKMRLFGKALEQQYMSNCWMGGNGMEKVDNFQVYARRRVNTAGGFAQITLCGIMDGFHEPELEYIIRNQNVAHFRFLTFLSLALVHDLLSLKKELKAGDMNNVVLMWVKKGKSLQDSINKTIKKHDQFIQDLRDIYNFQREECKEDPKLLEYLDFVLKNFSGLCQFQGLVFERYGHLRWSIDQHQNL